VLQRIVLIILALYALWRILTAWGRRLGREGPGADSYSRFNPDRRRQRTGRRSDGPSSPEQLVACSQCGTYVPTRRALTVSGGLFFCGEECRNAHELPTADDRPNG
jgi:hypothetical protein